MGLLRREDGERVVRLGARSVVGRSEGCAVRLRARSASGEHAVLLWAAGGWHVRDLGSTNGTRLDGKPLTRGERAPVRKDCSLVFGDPAERWTLVEDDPPAATAHCDETGEVRTAEQGLLALPDTEAPLVTLFEDADARWLIELDGVVRPAVDGESIVADTRWSIHLPPATQAARLSTTLALAEDAPQLVQSTRLRFHVSRDEEHVALSLVDGARVISLGAHAHNDVLLALARARLHDEATHVAAPEQGWLYVEDLLPMLHIDLQHLNVNLFRARQKLARTGVIDAGAVFQRRSTTRQIRLGVDAVEIVTT